MKKYGRTYDHCILISLLRRALTVQSVHVVPGNVTENAAAANQQLQNVAARRNETTESTDCAISRKSAKQLYIAQFLMRTFFFIDMSSQ